MIRMCVCINKNSCEAKEYQRTQLVLLHSAFCAVFFCNHSPRSLKWQMQQHYDGEDKILFFLQFFDQLKACQPWERLMDEFNGAVLWFEIKMGGSSLCSTKFSTWIFLECFFLNFLKAFVPLEFVMKLLHNCYLNVLIFYFSQLVKIIQ